MVFFVPLRIAAERFHRKVDGVPGREIKKERARPVIEVEACIDCDSLEDMEKSVNAAYKGGASTLELCSDMASEGLTPSEEAVRRSRRLFSRNGLMVMVRSRKGGFYYSPEELEAMCGQIDSLARAGADGVVFGALDCREERIHEKGLSLLVKTAKERGLRTTFHRAFDALQDPLEALEILAALGVDRVLTSGIPWGKKAPVYPRLLWLQKVATRNRGRLQLVLGGGITPENAASLVKEILPWGPLGLVHAYSGIREGGITSAAKVTSLRERLSLSLQ